MVTEEAAALAADRVPARSVSLVTDLRGGGTRAVRGGPARPSVDLLAAWADDILSLLPPAVFPIASSALLAMGGRRRGREAPRSDGCAARHG
ncbi:hypothetical protein NUM3379_36600 [Kineococcus sp. NUM-3379]